jgi:hypothetical protein
VKKKERGLEIRQMLGKLQTRRDKSGLQLHACFCYKHQLPRPPPLSLHLSDVPTCLSNRLEPHISLFAINQPVLYFLSLLKKIRKKKKTKQKTKVFFVAFVCDCFLPVIVMQVYRILLNT